MKVLNKYSLWRFFFYKTYYARMCVCVCVFERGRGGSLKAPETFSSLALLFDLIFKRENWTHFDVLRLLFPFFLVLNVLKCTMFSLLRSSSRRDVKRTLIESKYLPNDSFCSFLQIHWTPIGHFFFFLCKLTELKYTWTDVNHS